MEIVSPKKNMELAERKKVVSNIMLEPKRDIDYPIHLGIPVETDSLQKKASNRGTYNYSIRGSKKQI